MAIRLPNTTERTVITTEAAKGVDTALPVRDRRTRAQISPTTNIAAGTSVFVGQDEYMVIGPARGEGWALLAFIDDDGNRCFGTFHETQFTTVRPAGR